MTETETKWAERVREWRASNQTLEEFARGREYRPSTLRYWASEFKKDADSSGRREGGVKVAGPFPTSTGVDALPGDYIVKVTYTVIDGTKTASYPLSLR